MAIVSPGRAGALLLAAAGTYWAAVATPFEAVQCASVTLGFGLLAWGATARHPAPWLAAGLVATALGTSLWVLTPLQAGDLDNPWLVFGLGIDVAALAALLALRRPLDVRLPMRVGFGVVGVAGAMLLAAETSVGAWALSYLATIAGATLLVLRPLAPHPTS